VRKVSIERKRGLREGKMREKKGARERRDIYREMLMLEYRGENREERKS
jgi:hypothetical protein